MLLECLFIKFGLVIFNFNLTCVDAIHGIFNNFVIFINGVNDYMTLMIYIFKTLMFIGVIIVIVPSLDVLALASVVKSKSSRFMNARH